MGNKELSLSVFLRKDYQPHFFDLSGEKIFDFYLDIKRCHPSDTEDRDLTLLVNKSLFDISYAFREGLLELIDEETGAVVVWPTNDKELPMRQENKFITLPKKSSTLEKRGDRIRSIPFTIFNELSSVLQPGRHHRIWLRDLDLNVKWWSFNPPDNLTELDLLPPSEKQRLVAKTTTNKLFCAISSIRSPPPISVTISLLSSTVSCSNSPPTLRVSITNNGPKTITVKSSGEQPYTSTNKVNPRDSQITHQNSFPSLRNFLITSSAGHTILNIPNCPSAGSYGVSTSSFTTLEPGLPLVMEGKFLVQDWIRKKLKERGSEELRLTLKRQEAWWYEGNAEELFEGKEKLSWQSLWRSACLPVVLQSEDVVLFRVAD